MGIVTLYNKPNLQGNLVVNHRQQSNSKENNRRKEARKSLLQPTYNNP